ncbi:MAG: dephospho-CoA kinase [Flavobacteriales bacterium]|nr:dephospho-CoA kinase [Flavobacteriales bacterium]
MLKIGLTGGMGSGKSTVARIFGVLGVPVFEADAQAKDLMNRDPRVREAVSACFGPEVYREGVLDRKQLATLVFGDEARLASLNAIVHPAVRGAFQAWAMAQQAPYVLMEAAIMAENDGFRIFDRVINVSCPEAVRIQRVMARDGVGEAEVRARMRHQASEDQRDRIAHLRIRNDGSELVIPQVLAMHEQLLQMAAA